jgi:hypothetical protein
MSPHNTTLHGTARAAAESLLTALAAFSSCQVLWKSLKHGKLLQARNSFCLFSWLVPPGDNQRHAVVCSMASLCQTSSELSWASQPVWHVFAANHRSIACDLSQPQKGKQRPPKQASAPPPHADDTLTRLVLLTGRGWAVNSHLLSSVIIIIISFIFPFLLVPFFHLLLCLLAFAVSRKEQMPG